MALNLTVAPRPVAAAKTVNQDIVDAVQASWENENGFTVPLVDLDPTEESFGPDGSRLDGPDYDRAVRTLRLAGDAIGLGVQVRRVVGDNDSLWFTAQVKRTRKTNGK